jgi:epsilon-lactone hydrolase
VTLPPERPGHAAPLDLIARRAAVVEAVSSGYWRTEAEPEQVAIGGIRCLRFAPAQAPWGTVLHIHGGAFRIGCPETVAPFAAALAARCAVTVICPTYRLAPEYPFPAGLRDCLTVLVALSKYAQSPLCLSGDSAGGGLAATLAAMAAGLNISLAGLVLLSPWLDLTVSSASYSANADTDPLFSADAAREAAGLYLQGIDADEPLASPLLGAVKAFPPSFITVGAGEVLLDDAEHLHARLCSAGIASRLEVVADMEHVAVTRDRTLPGAAQTFDALVAFIETTAAR